MVPKIDPKAFLKLQDYKAFYVKSVNDRIIALGLNVKTLEEECASSEHDSRRTQKKQIKRAIEGDPINHSHAVGIVEALERYRNSTRNPDSIPPLVENDVIIGALFYVMNMEETCDKHGITKKDVVDGLRVLHPAVEKQDIEGTIDQLMAGNRVTLPLALDVVRVLNGLLRAKGKPTLDPRQVITTNNKNLKRAPCKWQVLEIGPYADWPPTAPLRPQDEP